MSNIHKYLSLAIVSTWSLFMLLSVANAETVIHVPGHYNQMENDE